MKFEEGKEYKTRDNRLARVYTIQGALPYSIHGAVYEARGVHQGWYSEIWTAEGVATEAAGKRADLMSEAREWWLVTWTDGPPIVYDSKEKARALEDEYSAPDEIIHVREVLEK